MVAEELELAVNVCVPEIDMRPEIEIVPDWAPPANDPPDSDVELAVSGPLPGVYVPLVMFSDPPTVMAPVLAVKVPPATVRSPALATVTPLDTVVVPAWIVMDATEEDVPTLVSSEQSPLMTTLVWAGALLVPGMHPEQGGDQIQRPEFVQLFRETPLTYLAVEVAAADPLNAVTAAATSTADAIENRDGGVGRDMLLLDCN